MGTGIKSTGSLVAALLWLFVIAAPGPARGLELKAGAAKAVITPDPYTPRITVMGNMSTGVNHDLYARVLSLNDGQKRMIIVTYDLNCLDVATPILRSRCRHELGIEPAYLVLMATHNHAAPIQIVPANFDYGRWLAERLFALIKEAIANEQGPAKLMFGSGRGAFLRSDPRYPSIYGFRGQAIDDEVQVLKVMRGDQVAALLFNQPTHPMQESFRKLGVGHPGFALDEIEQRMPGTLALYADACGADQFARRGLVMWAPLPMVKSIAHQLADTVLKISAGPMQDVTGPINSKLEVISLPLAPPLSYDEALQLVQKEKIPTDIGLAPYPHPDRESNWIRSLLMHYQQKIPFPTRTADRICTDDAFLVPKLEEPREFPCVYEETIVARIGPMILVAMQGEVCAPIGLKIKDAFRDQMPVMLFAYMGEHNLYIPTRDLVLKNAYQSQVIQIQYASPVGWAPEVEEEMENGVIAMIKSILIE